MTNDEILARNLARAEAHNAESDRQVRLKAEDDKIARRLIEDGVDLASFRQAQDAAKMAAWEAEEKARTDARSLEERTMKVRELFPEQV